jgi:FtsZ-binding cell division protein ZapB
MQDKELNRATTGVVSSIDISSRTADEIKRCLQTEEKRGFWRANSAILGYLMAIGLLVALLAPLPARADPGGIPGEIAALQAQMASLQSTVSTLQEEIKSLQSSNATLQDQVNTLKTANTALQNEINGLQASNTTLQKQLATVQSNHALLLGPFVNVDPNPEIGVIGPNIIFSGANIHIVSGSGATNDNDNSTGLGNLIIGYDEEPMFGGPLNPSDRGGSHNLIIGPGHRFTDVATGGFVAGSDNIISNASASVTGGWSNTASGEFASVNGGTENTASGVYTSVLGGIRNTAGGIVPPIAGSTVVGGEFNTAGGRVSVVLGGQGVIDNKDDSIAPQPPFP